MENELVGVYVALQQMSVLRDEAIERRIRVEEWAKKVEEENERLLKHTENHFLEVFEHGESSGFRELLNEDRIDDNERLRAILALVLAARDRHTRASESFRAAREQYTSATESLESTRANYTCALEAAETSKAHAEAEREKYQKVASRMLHARELLEKQHKKMENLQLRVYAATAAVACANESAGGCVARQAVRNGELESDFSESSSSSMKYDEYRREQEELEKSCGAIRKNSELCRCLEDVNKILPAPPVEFVSLVSPVGWETQLMQNEDLRSKICETTVNIEEAVNLVKVPRENVECQTDMETSESLGTEVIISKLPKMVGQSAELATSELCVDMASPSTSQSRCFKFKSVSPVCREVFGKGQSGLWPDGIPDSPLLGHGRYDGAIFSTRAERQVSGVRKVSDTSLMDSKLLRL
eukprot:CAMPEP_0113844590 /NCGR_PEP_ID=MMETSP0372-20130328/314_1 /TAXON_ID=340204 /ORGANISM="Lankesteria abbotti" /LENGTH=415 /DNA_ID=CAMNT_0000813595 /DNA_START=71 /DNA_END=1321 /DNA_ORIENTATION=+ /assembly_acc=CAM_ASM_000359